MRKLVLGGALVMSLVVLAVGAGCAAKPQARGKSASGSVAVSGAADATKKDIVHIVSRNRTVTVSSSSRGLLYSLKDADGRVQIADATESKFAELQPALFQQIKHYIAAHADTAPAISAGSDAPVPTADLDDAPIPTADVRRDGPSINTRTFRGGAGGASSDQFNRTAERPFPTAREDAPD